MTKILIIRLSSLGDIILTTPIVDAFHSHYPDSEIDFLTKSKFSQVLKDNPQINKIVKFNSQNDSIIKLAKLIKVLQYDLIIDLHSNIRTSIIKLFNRGTETYTYNKQHLHRSLLTKKFFRKKLQPISSTVKLYKSALQKIDVRLPSSQPRFYLPENSKYIYMKFNFPQSDYTIVLAPGAAHQTKQYPAEKYVEIINKLDQDFSATFILVGDKKDKIVGKQIKESAGRSVIDVTGETSIKELGVIISYSDLFISGDTGPMHMAAGLSVPQIAIFGATHPMLGFAPINEDAVEVQKDLSCRPCSLHGSKKCPKKHMDCLQKIEPTQIIGIARKLLEINRS